MNIEVITCTELGSLSGEAGNFRAALKNQPRYIMPERCTACGDCQRACPAQAVNEFNLGLDRRTATYIMYPQAVPRAFVRASMQQKWEQEGCPPSRSPRMPTQWSQAIFRGSRRSSGRMMWPL